MITKNLGYKCLVFGVAFSFVNCAYAQSSLDKLKQRNAKASERNELIEESQNNTASNPNAWEPIPNMNTQNRPGYISVYTEARNKKATEELKGTHIDTYVEKYSAPWGTYKKEDGGKILTWKESVLTYYSIWGNDRRYEVCETKIITNAKGLIQKLEQSSECNAYHAGRVWDEAYKKHQENKKRQNSSWF